MHKLLHQLVWSISPRIAVSSGVWIFHHPNPCRILSINMGPINGTAFRSWYLCPDLLLWPFNSLSLQFAPFKLFEEENSRFVGTCRRANISFKPSPFSNLKINLTIFHAGGYHRKDHQMKCIMCSFLCVSTIEKKGSIISKDITGQQSSLKPGGGESHCWAQIRARWQASGRFRRELLTGWMVEGFCMTWCFIQLGGCRVAVGDLPENHPLFFWFVGSQSESKCSGLKTPEKWDEQFFCFFSLVENLAPWVVATMLWKPFPGFGHTLYIHTYKIAVVLFFKWSSRF